MDVTIKFTGPLVSASQGDDALISQHFTMINLRILEPKCPFCGQNLQSADCNCSQYRLALKDMLNSFGDGVHLRLPENMFLGYVIPFEHQNLEIRKVRGSFDFIKFDFGTQQDGRLLTRGCWQNNVLSFYIRKYRDKHVFYCKIKNLNFSPEENPKIVLYKMETHTIPHHMGKRFLGGYRRQTEEKIVAEMSYNEFLKKLKK